MKKNSLIVAMLTLIALSVTLGIGSVSAQPATTVTIYPTTRLGPYTANTILSYQVRIWLTSGIGAPHETHEPTLATDKTWAWEVVINYNPTVLSVEADPPYRDTTRDWFNIFHKYSWDAEMGEWIDKGSYGNFFAGVADDAKGEVAATCTMTEDVTTIPIAVDDMGDPHDPGVHAGAYYDLPYSDGLVLSGYTYNYFILFNFRVTLLKSVGEGMDVRGALLHITGDTKFIEYDKTTIYPVVTQDAIIGFWDPEFPLGIGVIMILAPVIPIVYLWRTRKKNR